tara:strand:+ start:288 stop:458 length:171 start_codon:yes stop_codon:yes gene_type:complete
MKILLFLLFFLFSCTNKNIKTNSKIDDIDIYKNNTFDEFKNEIIEYAKKSNYPDIN